MAHFAYLFLRILRLRHAYRTGAMREENTGCYIADLGYGRSRTHARVLKLILELPATKFKRRLMVAKQSKLQLAKSQRTSKEARGMRQLEPGRMLRAQTADDGRLLELRYSSGLIVMTVKPEGDGFRVAEEVAALERRVEMRSAEIRSSLLAAIDAAGLTDAVAKQLTDIFSTETDFNEDLRSGDRFTVVYEMFYEGGEPVSSGRVLGAEFLNAGEALQPVWFQHSKVQGDYYTPEGESIKKAFLRSPSKSPVLAPASRSPLQPSARTLARA